MELSPKGDRKKIKAIYYLKLKCVKFFGKFFCDPNEFWRNFLCKMELSPKGGRKKIKVISYIKLKVSLISGWTFFAPNEF